MLSSPDWPVRRRLVKPTPLSPRRPPSPPPRLASFIADPRQHRSRGRLRRVRAGQDAVPLAAIVRQWPLPRPLCVCRFYSRPRASRPEHGSPAPEWTGCDPAYSDRPQSCQKSLATIAPRKRNAACFARVASTRRGRSAGRRQPCSSETLWFPTAHGPWPYIFANRPSDERASSFSLCLSRISCLRRLDLRNGLAENIPRYSCWPC